MAVGDHVIVNVLPLLSPRLGGPIVGRVVAEAAGPPATADVLWYNGKRTDGINQNALAKLHGGGSLALLIGKWAQMVKYNPLGAPAAGDAPKSPAAAGVVHSAFGLSAYDGVAATAFMVFMSLMNARVPWIAVPIDDSQASDEQLSTHTQRRNIGRD